MANAVRNAILRKKVNGILTDLMTKTTAVMVQVDDTTTLADKLTTITNAITEAQGKLTTLNGNDATVGSVLNSIKTEIEKITNNSDSGSLDTKIKGLQDAINGITGTDGVLKNAKDYTDSKLGAIGGNNTVTEYVTSVKETLEALIAGAFHFKGAVQFYEDLATKAGTPRDGDVWQVKYAGTKPSDWNQQEETSETVTPKVSNAEYAYDGEKWVELGSIIDLSGYYTKTEVDSQIQGAKTAAEAVAGNAQKYGIQYANKRIGDISGTGAETDTSKEYETTVKKYVDDAKQAAITAAASDAETKANGAKDAANAYTDGKLGTITNGTVAADIAAAKTAAQQAAEATAKQYTDTELGKKGRVVVTEEDSEPSGLAEGDLLIYILPESTTSQPQPEEEDDET